jgi:hypothetical protein
VVVVVNQEVNLLPVCLRLSNRSTNTTTTSNNNNNIRQRA